MLGKTLKLGLISESCFVIRCVHIAIRSQRNHHLHIANTVTSLPAGLRVWGRYGEIGAEDNGEDGSDSSGNTPRIAEVYDVIIAFRMSENVLDRLL